MENSKYAEGYDSQKFHIESENQQAIISVVK